MCWQHKGPRNNTISVTMRVFITQMWEPGTISPLSLLDFLDRCWYAHVRKSSNYPKTSYARKQIITQALIGPFQKNLPVSKLTRAPTMLVWKNKTNFKIMLYLFVKYRLNKLYKFIIINNDIKKQSTLNNWILKLIVKKILWKLMVKRDN